MDWIDAPVSGGPAGVERGTLVVMAGGDTQPYEKVRDLVASYASRFTLMGPQGAGQSTKLINQTLVAAHVSIVAEATQLALDAGIGAELVQCTYAGLVTVSGGHEAWRRSDVCSLIWIGAELGQRTDARLVPLPRGHVAWRQSVFVRLIRICAKLGQRTDARLVAILRR